MYNTQNFLSDIVQGQHKGCAAGIYSICSANRFVIEAGMDQAKADGTILLVESTPNQVNQFGGYAGMTPAVFAAYVREIAAEMHFPFERIILGGDHMGPHVWRREKAQDAMDKGCQLVRDYVAAGFTKIHLDASMPCSDDQNRPLPDEIIMKRTAELCAAAEDAQHQLSSGKRAPLYVIGTEVPIPGGEQEVVSTLSATRAEDLDRTIELGRKAFQARRLDSVWERVIAVVVQPAVEFGDATVFDYDRENVRLLARQIECHPGFVFEAHSTDYQTRRALRQMVEDHFAILKVGPALTFAFREAIFALAAIEEECLPKPGNRSQIRNVLDAAMMDDPRYWQTHYHGDADQLRMARMYSFSDRSRYYWLRRDIQQALARLLANLQSLPLTLLSQYMPVQYHAIREGRLACSPLGLIRHKIMEVIDDYAYACGMR